MAQISSRSNPAFQRLLRLMKGKPPADGVERDDVKGMPVLLEGIHLCQEWRRLRGKPELAVVDAAQLAAAPDWLTALLRDLRETELLVMPQRLLAALSGIAAAQGVLFLARHHAPALPARITGDSVWLDRIQDPGNVGTLLRVVAGAGLRQVLLSAGCAQAWSPRVLRAGQGAQFVLEIHEGVDLDAVARRTPVRLFAAALGAGAQSVHDVDLRAPTAWIFGNEGQGVAPELLAQVHCRVCIPQDAAVESLNVAVAAGICLFEQRRQRGAAARQNVRRSSPT